ncbi:MAG: hypothetical protein ACRYG8_19865, partial [Janthinobacterium lividum]
MHSVSAPRSHFKTVAPQSPPRSRSPSPTGAGLVQRAATFAIQLVDGSFASPQGAPNARKIAHPLTTGAEAAYILFRSMMEASIEKSGTVSSPSGLRKLEAQANDLSGLLDEIRGRGLFGEGKMRLLAQGADRAKQALLLMAKYPDDGLSTHRFVGQLLELPESIPHSASALDVRALDAISGDLVNAVKKGNPGSTARLRRLKLTPTLIADARHAGLLTEAQATYMTSDFDKRVASLADAASSLATPAVKAAGHVEHAATVYHQMRAGTHAPPTVGLNRIPETAYELKTVPDAARLLYRAIAFSSGSKGDPFADPNCVAGLADMVSHVDALVARVTAGKATDDRDTQLLQAGAQRAALALRLISSNPYRGFMVRLFVDGILKLPDPDVASEADLVSLARLLAAPARGYLDA